MSYIQLMRFEENWLLERFWLKFIKICQLEWIGCITLYTQLINI